MYTCNLFSLFFFYISSIFVLWCDVCVCVCMFCIHVDVQSWSQESSSDHSFTLHIEAGALNQTQRSGIACLCLPWLKLKPGHHATCTSVGSGIQTLVLTLVWHMKALLQSNPFSFNWNTILTPFILFKFRGFIRISMRVVEPWAQWRSCSSKL